jgi:integrase
VQLVLSTSRGLRINYKTWNERSWKPALVAAGVIRTVGEKIETHGARIRRHPEFERSRRDMFHVLRHTYASVQLEAGESIVSVSAWLGHSSPKITLDHYAHFMPGRASAGSRPWTRGSLSRGRKSLRSPWRTWGSRKWP